MKKLLVILLFFFFKDGLSQLTISGEINLSEKWLPKLYILKVNQVEPQSPVLVDSIALEKDGKFHYSFKNTNPQDIFYKILIPQKEGNRWAGIGTNEKNFFFISLEESKSINITAYADSLFYSVKINGGEINRSLLAYRDIQKPFYNLEKVLRDSIERKPEKAFEYKQQLLPVWMKQIDVTRKNVISILDTAQNPSMILMGLYNLFEANLGKLDSATIHKYVSHVKNDDFLIVKNLKRLASNKKSHRIGLQLPNAFLSSITGHKKNLHDFKGEFSVIDFWASWCSPCRYANKNELPQVYSKYKDRVSLLGITIDKEADRWKKAVSTDDTSWGQYIEPSYSLKKLLEVDAVPVYLVLDKNHLVIFETISVYQLEKFLEEKFKK
jgi:thiol-disulfide isomerase/thioredoxin